MAAQVMREGRVQAVITGADRIAANGDTANKIGTYGVAVLAARPQHSVLRRRPDAARSTCRSPAATGFPSSSATRRGNHARLRPADRARRHRGLQPGLRRHAVESIAPSFANME